MFKQLTFNSNALPENVCINYRDFYPVLSVEQCGSLKNTLRCYSDPGPKYIVIQIPRLYLVFF